MRINLIGAAGCGKSTLASGIFYHFKKNGWNIEISFEFVKSWAYQGRIPQSFDQLYIFSKQLHAEDSMLSAGVSHIVTDSPIPLSIFYAQKYGFDCCDELMSISRAFDKKHQSLNIFLDREAIPYQELGRYVDEKNAIQDDLDMKTFLNSYGMNYVVMKSTDFSGIISLIDSQIG